MSRILPLQEMKMTYPSDTVTSTRGVFGVVVDDNIKVAWCQFDSHPEFLGRNIIRAARRICTDYVNYRHRARELKVVDPSASVPHNIEKRFLRLRDHEPLKQMRPYDGLFHSLFTPLQGDLLGVLDSGYIVDATQLLGRSYLHWGYIVNFDYSTFDVYRGNVQSLDLKSPISGSFARWDEDGKQKILRPPHQFAAIPLNKIKEEHDEGLVNLIYELHDVSCRHMGQEREQVYSKSL